MMIIDPEGKEREVEDLKIVVHDNMNAVDGEVAEQIEYVEVTVIGKNRVWPNWYPLDEFRKLNPHVDI
jgi:hypothetical protein